MAFTRPSYATNNIRTLPTDNNGNVTGKTEEELKEAFDKVGEDAKAYITNTLLAELEAKTAATSTGALSVVDGTTASNVQAELDRLKSGQDGIVLGQLPDASVTVEKLEESVLGKVNEEINLVDMFNIPSISDEVMENQPIRNDNIIPSTWTASGTSYYYNGDYKITSSNFTSSYRTFDGDISTHPTVHQFSTSGHITLEFPIAQKITKMKTYIKGKAGNILKIQGSKDNSTWTDLSTFSTQSQLTEITLSDADYYKYIRFYASKGTENYIDSVEAYAIEVSEYEGQVTDNVMLLSHRLDSYTNNKMIYIEIPEDLNINTYNYININNLGNKLITGTIEINKKYMLVYDGTTFVAHKLWFES